MPYELLPVPPNKRNAYTAFGLPLSSSGSSVNPFRYVGQWGYYDDGAMGSPHDFVLCGVRYYAPRYGRFLTWDPIGERRYGYCDNSATMAVDPSGRIAAVSNQGWFQVYDPCGHCFKQARDKVRKLLLEGKPSYRDNDGGIGNAIGHCAVSCVIMRTCPDCIEDWLSRDLPIDQGQRNDTWNNLIGIGISGNRKEQCVDLCKRHQGDLRF